MKADKIGRAKMECDEWERDDRDIASRWARYILGWTVTDAIVHFSTLNHKTYVVWSLRMRKVG